mgnify:CR=1 FL=1
MPVTINGNGTVTGISAGGLPDGCITADDLASGAGGKILQHKIISKNNQSSITGTTPTAIPDFSITITPTASDSTMVVEANVFYSISDGNVICTRIYNGTSILISPNSYAGGYQSGSSAYYVAEHSMFQQHITAFETSGNTNSRTYNVYWCVTGNTGWINKYYSGDYHQVSTLRVTEVAA